MDAPSPAPHRPAGEPAAPEPPLEARLRQLLDATAPTDPLPTTRALGERFRVANTTVFRALQRLAAAGEVWQQPSGRFYPAAARELLERPRPVACLTRRLELCSELYRELLEGISAGCGTARRTMLLWHDELLVNHPDPSAPPRFATLPQQRGILADFLGRHGAAAGGFILDHLWSDRALQEQTARLTPAVVLFRRCRLPSLHNVYADLDAGALQALAHLLARGFSRIVPIEPFPHDPAVHDFLAALAAAATRLACRDRLAPTRSAARATDRATLVDDLQAHRERTALLCPEDHVASLLLTRLRETGVDCPGRVGVFSAMGTDIAARAGLSCLRYDYRALGRQAVAALAVPHPQHLAHPANLHPGATT